MSQLPDDTAENSQRPGEYVVVARRYRPQSFTDLIGQQQVSQALSNAIATSRVGHAYLFTGARGVGKTSTARILAKCLNCADGPTDAPCGKCDACVGIATGEDVDVLEIDGASNRGIDEIRQLRLNVNIRPSRSRFKIYIIDEVHMLTTPAFNALLKTLEEPPQHVKFIFCTTDPEKIPITVVSRCQRFDFTGIETESIVSRLRQIVDAEGVEAEDEALWLLARRAAGSMRDSQSLQEQLLAFAGERLTAEDVHHLLGTARSGRLAALTARLIERDAAGALAELDASLGEGVDVGQLTEQLLGRFRDMMAAAVGGSADLMLHSAAEEFEAIAQAAQEYGLATLLAAVQILDQALVRMRQSAHPRTLAETAVVRICHLEDLQQLSALIQKVREGGPVTTEKRPAPSAPRSDPAPHSTAAPRSTPAPAEGESPDRPEKKTADGLNWKPRSDAAHTSVAPASQRATASPAGPPQTVAAAKAPPALAAKPLTAESAASLWEAAAAEVGGMTRDHALRYVSTAISAPNRLVISFPATYTSSKTQCERPERRIELEKTLSAACGQQVRLEFKVSEIPADKTPPPPVRSQVPTADRKRQVATHPMVRQAIELFDATVLEVVEQRPAGEPSAGDES